MREIHLESNPHRMDQDSFRIFFRRDIPRDFSRDRKIEYENDAPR